MALNKFQLKALVFKIIEPLRHLSAIDDSLVQSVLSELKSIEDADYEFISRILTKEADCNFQKSAAAFLYIAELIAPDAFLGHIMNELKSNRVSDNQKIFYINILSGLGVKFAPEDVADYLSDPDEAINSETKRFLECAKVDPEAQIDFLDFYFASSEIDRKELLNSVATDSDMDRHVNILSALVLVADEMETVLYCLDIIEKSRSLLAIKPLRYLSASKYEKIAKRASKALRKFSLMGIYTEEKLNEFYKELLEDFSEPEIKISIPDGNSNFSLVVSRKTKDDAYFILFIAINTELGPFSVFGFSSVTKKDRDSVIKRFFADRKQIPVSPAAAKKILDTLVIKRIKAGKIIPYEYYCWERITDDIELIDTPLEEILTDGLKKVPINGFEKKIINNSPFIDNWFFRYSANFPFYSKMIDEILLLNPSNLEDMENILEKYSEDEKILNNIKTRIKYLAFCLKNAECPDLADVYYSLLFDENVLKDFVINILKRSIYEHMLNLRLPAPSKKTNIFKKPEIKRDANLAQTFIDYIEKNWVEN